MSSPTGRAIMAAVDVTVWSVDCGSCIYRQWSVLLVMEHNLRRTPFYFLAGGGHKTISYPGMDG